jgi:hypothetical protein
MQGGKECSEVSERVMYLLLYTCPNHVHVSTWDRCKVASTLRVRRLPNTLFFLALAPRHLSNGVHCPSPFPRFILSPVARTMSLDVPADLLVAGTPSLARPVVQGGVAVCSVSTPHVDPLPPVQAEVNVSTASSNSLRHALGQ